MHFALGVFILWLGYHGRIPVLGTTSAECHAPNQTSTARVLPVEYTHVSSIYFLACMSSSIYAMAYLSFFSPGEEEQAAQYERFVDLMFWIFLSTQTYVSLGCTTERVAPMEQLYLRFTVRMGALYIICSCHAQKAAASVAFVVMILSSVFEIGMMVCSESVLVVSYLHRFLEMILLVSHYWDQDPEKEMLLNCRLCYVALAGAMLHADMIVA